MLWAVEQAVRYTDPHLQDEARTRVVGALSKLSNSKAVTVPFSEKQALERLQNNRCIVIPPAHTGNATVTFHRSDYVPVRNSFLEYGPMVC